LLLLLAGVVPFAGYLVRIGPPKCIAPELGGTTSDLEGDPYSRLTVNRSRLHVWGHTVLGTVGWYP